MRESFKLHIKTKLRISDICFYLAYILYLVFSILVMSMYSRYIIGTVYNSIKVMCILLLLFREFQMRKTNKKSILAIMLITFFLGIIWQMYSGIVMDNIFWILVFLYCSRNMDFIKISKITIWVSAFIFIFIFFSAKLGLILSIVNTSGGKIREYMGFSNVFCSSSIIFNISALIIVIKREEIKWKELLILFFLNYWIFLKTINRLIFVLSICLIIGAMLFKVFPQIKEKKVLWNICSTSFIISGMFSILTSIFYNSGNNFLYELNEFLGNRLQYGKLSLLKYGIRLFGQDITWVGNGVDSYGKSNNTGSNYDYVDSVYIQILQKYGIILFSLFLLLITVFICICVKMKEIYLVFIFGLIAIHGIIDDMILYVPYNTFWLIVGGILIGFYKPPINNVNNKKRRRFRR